VDRIDGVCDLYDGRCTEMMQKWHCLLVFCDVRGFCTTEMGTMEDSGRLIARNIIYPIFQNSSIIQKREMGRGKRRGI